MEISKKKPEKEKTKGTKQIAKENWETLCFYRNMILGANGLYFCVMTLLGRSYFSFDIGMFALCCVIYISCYQILSYMGKPKTTPEGQLLDCGIDLNMQQGLAEHIKDMIILTCATQELSIFSNYMWLLLLGAPIRAFYMLWVSVIAPWIFAPAEEEDAVSDKKRQKMERKMKRQQR